MGFHQFLGEGVHKINIYGELPKKGRNLQGACQKIGGWCFWEVDWCLDAHYDLIVVHAKTWDRTCWCEHV